MQSSSKSAIYKIYPKFDENLQKLKSQYSVYISARADIFLVNLQSIHRTKFPAMHIFNRLMEIKANSVF